MSTQLGVPPDKMLALNNKDRYLGIKTLSTKLHAGTLVFIDYEFLRTWYFRTYAPLIK